MARELVDVLDKVLAVVPADQQALAGALKSVRQSACFAAPEVMRTWWGRAQKVLRDWMEENPDLADAEWVVRSKRIWAGLE